MDSRYCKFCRTEKPLDQFRVRKLRHGLHRVNKCFDCEAATERDRYHKKHQSRLQDARSRNAALRADKLRVCKSCGESKPLDDFFKKKHPTFICLDCKTNGIRCSRCHRLTPPDRFPSGYSYCKDCMNAERNPQLADYRSKKREATTSRVCKACKVEKPLDQFRMMTRKRSFVCVDCESQRTCSQCQKTLPGTQFRLYHHQCFECERGNRAIHNKTEARRKSNREAEKRPRAKARRKRYLASEKGKEAQKRWWSRNQRSRMSRADARQKICARQAVWLAIQAGDLVKPEVCERCKGAAALEAHHAWGYERENWLKVQWLCKPCHKEADAEQAGQLEPALVQ